MGTSPDHQGYSRNYPGNKCALSKPPTQAKDAVDSFEVHMDEDHLKGWHWATCDDKSSRLRQRNIMYPKEWVLITKPLTCTMSNALI